MQKCVICLYLNSDLARREIKKTIYNCNKNNKRLGIYLTPKVKDLYRGNYMLLEETEDTNKCKR